MKKYFLLTILSLLIFGCDQKKSIESLPPEKEVRNILIPGFSPDSAYRYIEEQVAFGPRVPNTLPHQLCGDYLVDKLTTFGATVIQQEFDALSFDGINYHLRNIIASYYPEKTRRILLAAHWDTRKVADKDDERQSEPIDGANDGASGVGVLLEIARQLQTYEPDVGVDIILFDGEDNGADNNYQGSNYAEHNGWCLGSQYWAKNKHQRNYFAYYGILLDMVGAENSHFLRELESMRFAPQLVKKIWAKGNELGYGEYFINKDGGSILDDHIFVYNWGGIQMIDIIDYDPDTYFGSYHHTHDDNMDIIDKNTLKAVGETVTHVVYSERSAG